VRRSDLREISTFGWLEEGAGAIGMFFLSGAIWVAVSVAIEHWADLEKYKWAFAFCGLCGIAALWIAHKHFQMREDRITDYFEQLPG